MPRKLRTAVGGVIYHVLNRAVGRGTLFKKESDYQAFSSVLERTHQILPMKIISYCLMPNHWHLVLWPAEDGQLSEFMRLLTVTHTQRWHAHHHTAGTGPLYQGRFKSFPMQNDPHFLAVCRYVERNPLRAKLVKSAGDWAWGSLSRRAEKDCPGWLMPLAKWPVEPPSSWTAFVNRAESPAELETLRTCVKRGRPFGEDRWIARTAKVLDLESTLRSRGRQRIGGIKDS